MDYQVFYYCFDKKADVPGTEPKTVPASELPTIAETMLCDEGDFVGIIDREGATLQFIAVESGIWLEIPAPEESGSYGRHLEFEELIEQLKNLPATFAPDKFENFEFKPWGDDEIAED